MKTLILSILLLISFISYSQQCIGLSYADIKKNNPTAELEVKDTYSYVIVHKSGGFWMHYIYDLSVVEKSIFVPDYPELTIEMVKLFNKDYVRIDANNWQYYFAGDICINIRLKATDDGDSYFQYNLCDFVK